MGIMTIVMVVGSGVQIVNEFTIMTFILCLLLTPLQCFAEEYLCRGFLMQTFGSWFRIPIVAIILQAIVFASYHSYNLMGLISILLLGICYGFITWYSKGLEVSSGIHSANNILSFLSKGLGITAVSNEISILTILFSFALTLIILIIIIALEKKFKWFGFSEN